jgi:hypothetical protein
MTDASTESRFGRARLELFGWAAVGVVLIAGAVPWFLWRSDAVAAGLPVWLWWHVGWMALASVVFYAFTRRGWGIGVERRGDPEPAAGANSGGDRRG